MNDDQLAKLRAYQSAAARYRAESERYFPLEVLGARPALPMTPEAHAELGRLAAVRDAAQAAYDAGRA